MMVSCITTNILCATIFLFCTQVQALHDPKILYKPTISVPRLVEGEPGYAVCSVSVWGSAATLKWIDIKNPNAALKVQYASVNTTNNMFVSSARLEFMGTREMHKYTPYKCIAKHKGKINESKWLPFTFVRPQKPDIVTTAVLLKENTTLACAVVDANPIPLLFWMFGTQSIPETYKDVRYDNKTYNVTIYYEKEFTHMDVGSDLYCYMSHPTRDNHWIADKKIIRMIERPLIKPQTNNIVTYKGQRVELKFNIETIDEIIKVVCFRDGVLVKPTRIRVKIRFNNENATLVIKRVKVQEKGIYSCVAQTADTWGRSTNVTIDVEAKYTRVKIMEIPYGYSASMVCDIKTEETEPKVVWKFDDQPLKETGIKLSVTINSDDDYGNYSCQLKNKTGNKEDQIIYRVVFARKLIKAALIQPPTVESLVLLMIIATILCLAVLCTVVYKRLTYVKNYVGPGFDSCELEGGNY